MKMFFIFIIVVTISLHLTEGRKLWSVDLPEIKSIPLEKGKSIRLQKPYTKLQLCELNGTIYSDTLSQLHGVTELRICRSNIEKIETGGLCSSPDVKILDVDFVDVQPPPLTKQIFENCNNIEELILRFDIDNSTIKIDHDVLENFSNLKNLTFHGYNFPHLHKNFFKLPHNSLISLHFSYCNIEEIDADTFEDLKNLEEIAIYYNRKLKHIPKTLFKNNSKLKELILLHNGIEGLTWDEFEGLNKIEQLSLSGNRIDSFDAEKISENLPNLKIFDIELNPPPCKQTEAFVIELKKKLPDVSVTYKFDPGYFDSCEEQD